ncbi:contact-dependent growth inhibition system immunity protein [Promicromonospora sukumoe]|uniref:contact-dependent growth inhibition system immunity protein n=1 Tax=Promicromonospora sukumoe TaxID=88382 RepID=UPI00365E0727
MSEIRYLASTYFHADYDLEAESPLGVVAKYSRAESDSTVYGLRREIVRVLSEGGNEDDLAAVWLKDGHAAYDPRSDGLAFREWFTQIVAVLDGRRGTA